MDNEPALLPFFTWAFACDNVSTDDMRLTHTPARLPIDQNLGAFIGALYDVCTYICPMCITFI